MSRKVLAFKWNCLQMLVLPNLLSWPTISSAKVQKVSHSGQWVVVGLRGSWGMGKCTEVLKQLQQFGFEVHFGLLLTQRDQPSHTEHCLVVR